MLDTKKIESQKKLLKKLQGQALSLLDEAEGSTEENLLYDIDSFLSRTEWRYTQLLRRYETKDNA